MFGQWQSEGFLEKSSRRWRNVKISKPPLRYEYGVRFLILVYLKIRKQIDRSSKNLWLRFRRIRAKSVKYGWKLEHMMLVREVSLAWLIYTHNNTCCCTVKNLCTIENVFVNLEEDTKEKGKLYKPTSKLASLAETFSSKPKPKETKESSKDKGLLKKDKKKSNLEIFKEELRA